MSEQLMGTTSVAESGYVGGGSCEDCRFWSRYHPRGTWGACDLTLVWREKVLNRDTLAYATSTPDSQSARLMTKNIFGCAQFSQKKQEV